MNRKPLIFGTAVVSTFLVGFLGARSLTSETTTTTTSTISKATYPILSSIKQSSIVELKGCGVTTNANAKVGVNIVVRNAGTVRRRVISTSNGVPVLLAPMPPSYWLVFKFSQAGTVAIKYTTTVCKTIANTVIIHVN